MQAPIASCAHPAERQIYPESDHDAHSNVQVASLRVSAARGGPHSRAADLAAQLRAQSAEFDTIWRRHEVGGRLDGPKTIVHPSLGPMRLQCQTLFTPDQGQALLIFTATPGTDDALKLQMLSVIGTQDLAADADGCR